MGPRERRSEWGKGGKGSRKSELRRRPKEVPLEKESGNFKFRPCDLKTNARSESITAEVEVAEEFKSREEVAGKDESISEPHTNARMNKFMAL